MIYRHILIPELVKKNNKPVCRFNFPLPPMKHTCILEPLQADCNDLEGDKKHKGNFEKINKLINSLKTEDAEMDFTTFLERLKLDNDQYLKAIRSSLSSTKLFLKRSVSEVRVNSYNPTLLKCWRANMDLQYVLDAYSCAMYIVSYVAKKSKGYA